MIGIDASTGKSLEGTEHIAQSIRDILTTPIGSRVMRRDYGSELFRLVDSPTNEGGQVRIMAAVAKALAKWEPRVKLTRVAVTAVEEGHIKLDLEYTLLENGEPLRLEGIVV